MFVPMNRFFHFVLKVFLPVFLLGDGFVLAQAPQLSVPGSVPVKSSKDKGQVHLGISVLKPQESIYAHLPELPKGCGFILQSVASGAPAAKAGLRPMDIIWKLDGQLLVNENQMLVLLSHKKPGDQVSIRYFRSGKSEQLDVTLDVRGDQPPYPGELAVGPPLPGSPVMPMRVISYEDRSASISDKPGTATLTYREGKLWLHVENAQGEETFNDYIDSAEQIAAVPSVWLSRLPVLKRALEESTRLRKLPRIRSIPRPKKRMAAETSADGTP